MIYLASLSPRRCELLDQIKVIYQQIAVNVDETPTIEEEPASYVKRLALAKAQAGHLAVTSHQVKKIVLGADTAVVKQHRIFGKPRDANDAIDTLKQLSGQCHQVMTAVALVTDTQQFVALNVSQVYFRPLTHAEIAAYVTTQEPLDKAGSYAIQGVASVFIERIEGSYSGIVGLPLYETANLLKQVGIDITQGHRA